jgi:hypothetical protein
MPTRARLGPRHGPVARRRPRVPHRVIALALPGALLGLGLVAGSGIAPWYPGSTEPAIGAATPPSSARPTPGSAPGSVTLGGPAPAYRCEFNVATDAFTGAAGTASAIGWEGDFNSVVTCLGGTFLVQDGPHGLFREEGFGIYDGSPTTWTDADGWLPAQVTTFHHAGARVAITEFADRVVLEGDPYVAVYSRVAVTNPTDQPVDADPLAAPDLVPIARGSDLVAPHTTSIHDYVVATDRFGTTDSWPTATALARAGTFEEHFAHMKAFWQHQLASVARLELPDPQLVDAYDSGFVETQIARSGNHLDTGVNGYKSEFSHDVVGILTDLFTQGDFSDAHALLTDARNVVGDPTQYVDGLWTYPVPWAVYLLKTGDLKFVKANFSADGPHGAREPSIEAAAHAVAADRTGRDGTMEPTNDIDTQGEWTQDDEEALLGLAAYRYLADRVGDRAEASWAAREYQGLLAATNAALSATIAVDHLDYLPCALFQPNDANRCADPKDANWTSPLSIWAWEGSLLGAPEHGPILTMIDATYAYGFARLHGALPPGTTGGFPPDFYASVYDAAQGSAALAAPGPAYRDQGIVDYQFMISHTQSGPYSWWESSSAPAPSPWIGSHPAAGQGSSPHAWGLAGADKVLLDSLVAERTDGDLVVGRGVPPSWLRPGARVSVTNFPTTDGQRAGVMIKTTGSDHTGSTGHADHPGHVALSFTFSQSTSSRPVLLELPSFVENVAHTSAGTVDEATGTVTLSPAVRQVTVVLRQPPSASGV